MLGTHASEFEKQSEILHSMRVGRRQAHRAEAKQKYYAKLNIMQISCRFRLQWPIKSVTNVLIILIRSYDLVDR